MSESKAPPPEVTPSACSPGGEPLPEWEVECLSRLFSALGDPTRLKILRTLASSENGVSVGDLAESAGLSTSAISHQLRLLSDRNLVSARRAGRVVFYSIADDHVRTLIATGLEHAREDCPNRPRE